LRRAVAENPENALAWLGLAQMYRAGGPSALEDRLEALTRAASLLIAGGPAAGLLEGERAETLLRLGRFDEAKAAAQKALLMDRGLVFPRWILVYVAERRGAWAEARYQLRTILAGLEPGHPEADVIRRRLEAVERNLREGGSR
jgi:tetratricopeptide (TPR) repeat protein